MTGAVSCTIATESNLLAASFLFGIVLMLLYDVFRIFRHIVKHNTFLLAVEDILYWVFCAIGIFAMLYEENDGLLRWFVIGGVAAGMLLENYLVSPWVVRFFVKILRAWIRTAGKFLHIAGKPAKKSGIFFKKKLKKIRKAIKIGISKQ